ncbi:uncharacterized protein F4822DRAFT_445767 [Hypoxylon trugodes]|uniref:uncharacterized protein n=1 Tax=Hypoxylon trugodes TaxID=326681 RepID=UPI00219A933D|nr:uncharacterized protein F4822DRAFT_445767 [Hypoxylon trugodes]KAI1385937.1 hypothetical protein F4822DRAFT_445767 [Hypoxylon trugodes]
MFALSPLSRVGSSNNTMTTRVRSRFAERGANTGVSSWSPVSGSPQSTQTIFERDIPTEIVTLLTGFDTPTALPTSPTQLPPPPETPFATLPQSTITTPQTSPPSGAIIASIAIGGVFGLVVFLGILFVCCVVCRRIRRKAQRAGEGVETEANRATEESVPHHDGAGMNVLVHHASRSSQQANGQGGHHSGAAMGTTSSATSGSFSGGHGAGGV